MNKISWVIQEVLRGGRSVVEIDGPVEEGCAAADGEDYYGLAVHGDGF